MLDPMIDFKNVWLPQIVGYATIISNGQLEDQWLGRLGEVTSVTNPDELQEQVFGDLDADTIWIEARERAELPTATIVAIDRLLASLHDVKESDATTLVSSLVWRKVRKAAHDLVANVRN
jgi:hypothetical protein